MSPVFDSFDDDLDDLAERCASPDAGVRRVAMRARCRGRVVVPSGGRPAEEQELAGSVWRGPAAARPPLFLDAGVVRQQGILVSAALRAIDGARLLSGDLARHAEQRPG